MARLKIKDLETGKELEFEAGNVEFQEGQKILIKYNIGNIAFADVPEHMNKIRKCIKEWLGNIDNVLLVPVREPSDFVMYAITPKKDNGRKEL